MDPSVVVGAAISFVIAVAATVVAGRLIEKRPDLRYETSSSGDMLPHNPQVPLEISYYGTPVTSLVQLRTRFTNEGNQPIQRVDVKFELETSGKEIHWMCSEPDRTAVVGRHEARITLLNPGESTHCEILVADDVNPKLRITGRGVGVVARPVQRPPNFQVVFWLTLLIGFLVNVAYFLTLQPLVHAAIANPWWRLASDVAAWVLSVGSLGLVGTLLLGRRVRRA